MTRSWNVIAIATSLLVCGQALAQVSHYDPFLEIEGRAGDGPERGQTRSFIPIFQDGSSLLFADLRSSYADNQAWEGNFGLGYRQILCSQRIFGVYGFYDILNSANSNMFHQGTVGVELLDVNWGLRANGYVPNDSVGNAPGGAATLVGNQIVFRANQERAYYGTDLEAEHVLWRNDCPVGMLGSCDVEIWGVGGYYYFDNDNAGFDEIDGPRARLEARMYDLPYLGNDSRLVFSGEYQHDDVRGSVTTGFLNVRIPLGPCGCNKTSKLNLLDRRMVTPIVRDLDIITDVSAAGEAEFAVNSKTGTVLDDVVVLTAEDNLLEEINGGPVGRTFLLDGVDGDAFLFNSINLNKNQILIGGGGHMNVHGEESGIQTVFHAPGAGFAINQNVFDGDDLIIEEVNFGGNLINLARNNGIYGLTLNGGDDTIAGFDPGNFEIAGNTLMNAYDDLIDINNGGFENEQTLLLNVYEEEFVQIGCILDNQFISADDAGIELNTSSFDRFHLNISDNTFESMGEDAIRIEVNGFGGRERFAANTQLEGASSNAIELDVIDDADFTALIENNHIEDVDNDAIDIETFGSSRSNIMIIGNTILGRRDLNDGDALDDGIDVEVYGDSELMMLVENNLIDDVDDGSLEVDVYGDSYANFMIVGNDFLGRGNTSDGVDFEVNDDAYVSIEARNNVFDDISDDAFEIGADDDSYVDVVFTGNRILGKKNTLNGVDIHLDDNASLLGDVSNNIFHDISDDAIEIDGHDDSDLDLLISGNTIRGSLNSNIEVGADDDMELDALILDNDIRGGDFGIQVFNNDGPNFVTIGGNKIRRIKVVGLLIDADDTLNIDDDGKNNDISTRAGGEDFVIDDDGDVQGSILINGERQFFGIP